MTHMLLLFIIVSRRLHENNGYNSNCATSSIFTILCNLLVFPTFSLSPFNTILRQ